MTQEALEKLLIQHLIESGEIRQDIVHLKEQAKSIVTGVWTVVGVSFLTLVSVIGFLLKVTLWK